MNDRNVFAITRASLGQRPFTVGSVAALQLLPTDPSRCYFFIQNNSSANLIVGIDGEPIANGNYMTLGPGNFWEPNVTPTNSIYVISASLTSARGVVIFGTLGGAI